MKLSKILIFKIYLFLHLWESDLGQLKWNFQAGHLRAISQVQVGCDIVLARPQQVNCTLKHSFRGILSKYGPKTIIFYIFQDFFVKYMIFS